MRRADDSRDIEEALRRLCNAPAGRRAVPVVPLRDWLDRHPVTRARAADRGGVCYDTPWEQADALAQRIAPQVGASAWWGDPCCGVGRLLLATLDALAASGASGIERALSALRFGDVDRAAGGLTRLALQRWAMAYACSAAVSAEDARRVARAALALSHPRESIFDWPPLSAGCVVTNPPFESIRASHRRLGRDAVEALRARFDVCTGAFDLGVPVVARCMELADGGALAVVAPVRWLSSGYAERLRHALDELGRWERVESIERPFDAQVDVLLAVLDRRDAPSIGDASKTLRWQQCDESPPGCVPLRELATIMSGTPGFDAKRVSNALRSESAPNDGDRSRDSAANGVGAAWRFYSASSVRSAPKVEAGDARGSDVTAQGLAELEHVTVRLCGRDVAAPTLPRDAVTSERRARFYDASKFVVPGVSRTLLASWSEAPAALSVGVVGIVPHTDEAKAQIARALVSDESQQWLQDVAPGRGLSNGFQRFPARLLARMPVRIG